MLGVERPLKIVSAPQTKIDFSELVQAYSEELWSHENACSYLESRKLFEHAHEFKLGFDPGLQRIVIPVYRADELVGIKYRAIDEGVNPKYTSETGSQAGVYEIQGDPSQVLICEGELDAISAYAMGFKGRILATQTNRIQAQVLSYYKDVIEQANKVYLCLDSDEPGRELERSLTELISLSKLAKLTLGKEIHDLNAFLVSGGDFGKVLAEAKTEMEQLSYSAGSRLADALDFMQNRRNIVGWSTGFSLLDQKLGGGLLPYTLTAISAPGKTGKTTMVIQMIFNLLVQNLKVGFMSLEMNPVTHVIPSLLSIISGRNIRKLDGEVLDKTVKEAVSSFPEFNNLVFMDRYGSTPAEMLKEWIMHQHLQNGVNVFFLDHVGYSLADIKDSNEHSRLSKTLRSLTREYPIHIVAIVQPRNLQFGQTRVTKADLYGSITWSQDINALITLERQNDGGLAVRVPDSHNPLARPGDDAVILFYDYETCSLSQG